ncbi:glycine betaine ABC transporter substrate-binding protein [Vallitalea okinawensis]|uniref:glycine betaine ABC transporter substrate-binding protein n=1 Tax=Vallitalea okinawensis TaxID=2078660 RepID=UPI001300BB13|nr:glycine betaine ABC transporter substrate-binding protein [Vallitalea okinawensis]
MSKKVLIAITTVCLAIGIIAFTLHARSQNNKIIVGTKNFTEQYILGEMITLLIEEYTDLDVEQKFGYSIPDIHEPLLKGEIDLYPEYTSTGWVVILDEPFIYQPDVLYQEVKRVYDEDFDVVWLDRYGFNNTYGLAMRNDQALEEGIFTNSDLALKAKPFTLGAERNFYIREDGYPGLAKKYGFNFKDKLVFEIGEKYEAIDQGEVDVIDIFTTDGLLNEYDLYVLYDDQHFFLPYQAATIIRGDTLREHPELREVLNKLGGQINNEEMSRLNYLVENSEMEPREAARLYLVSKGLIE